MAGGEGGCLTIMSMWGRVKGKDRVCKEKMCAVGIIIMLKSRTCDGIMF